MSFKPAMVLVHPSDAEWIKQAPSIVLTDKSGRCIDKSHLVFDLPHCSDDGGCFHADDIVAENNIVVGHGSLSGNGSVFSLRFCRDVEQ